MTVRRAYYISTVKSMDDKIASELDRFYRMGVRDGIEIGIRRRKIEELEERLAALRKEAEDDTDSE